MPELPEVETYRRRLARAALQRPIADLQLDAPRLLRRLDVDALRAALLDHPLVAARRHGKYLFLASAAGPWLTLHFGLSGEPRILPADTPPPRHTHLLLRFQDGGALAYVDPRKLGEIDLAPDPDTFVRAHRLGPDALTVTWPQFQRQAQRGRGMIKTWLMDQHHIAGIGNLYSDELLYQARLHPRHPLPQLPETDLRRLHGQLAPTLHAAIDAEADPTRLPPHFLLPHRHREGRCPRCRTPLARLKIGGRSSWHCPRCQPPP